MCKAPTRTHTPPPHICPLPSTSARPMLICNHTTKALARGPSRESCIRWQCSAFLLTKHDERFVSVHLQPDGAIGVNQQTRRALKQKLHTANETTHAPVHTVQFYTHLRASVADNVESLCQVSDVPVEAFLEDHAVEPMGVPRNLHRLLEEPLHLGENTTKNERQRQARSDVA